MTTPQIFEGLTIIDADTHFTEPHDLWTSRAPKGYEDRVPRVVPIDGVLSWVIDDVVFGRTTASGVVGRDGVKVPGTDFFNWGIDQLHAAASSIPERVEMLDEQGIWAEIVYPNAVGFGGQRFNAVADPAVRRLSVEIYNDAMAEMQEQSGGRFLPMGILPFWDIDFAVSEIERMKRIGLHGINTTSGPHNHGFPDLGTSHWDPVWEVASDLSMPINFHVAGTESALSWYGTIPWPSQNEGCKLGLGSAMMYINNAIVIGNIIYSGVLERHPKLQFVSVESGVGWIPFILDALDYGVEEMAPEDYAKLSMKPSEYFRRQFHSCFWFEHRLGEALDVLGWEHVMFETDFPHPTCLFPDALATAATALEDIADPDIRAGLMGNNAARLYNIEVPQLELV